jgi:hypothetical protein
VALVALWGGFEVALGCLWGAYPLAINTLWGGFDVALKWLWVALPGNSGFPLGCSMLDVADGQNHGRTESCGIKTESSLAKP